jgi:hypothetical protein
MRLIVVFSLVVSLAVPGVADAASYYLNRYEDGEITRYGSPDWYSDILYTSPLSVTPYRTTTHALHPYYRNSYYTRTLPSKKITRPEFYRYLEDLYYQNLLTGNASPQLQREAPLNLRCPNYAVRRESYRMPREFLGCTN